MEPAWHVDPKSGARVLVLPVYSSLNDGPPLNYEIAILAMTPKLAQGLLNRLEHMAKWKQDDEDLCEIAFRNYQVKYYPADHEADQAVREWRAPVPQWARKESCTDMDQLRVGEGWVEWHAYVKGTDVELRTASINSDSLRAYVNGDDPWQ